MVSIEQLIGQVSVLEVAFGDGFFASHELTIQDEEPTLAWHK